MSRKASPTLRRIAWMLLPLLAIAAWASAWMPRSPPTEGAPAPPDPSRVYASYHLRDAPDVLNFVQQPHWVPTCLLWEVMRRDPWLRADLRRDGCRLQPYPYFKGVDATESLRAGVLHGGMIGDLPVLNMAAQFDLRIVALCQQGPASIVARSAIPLAELKGRRIGYAPGTVADYTLLRALRSHGLQPRDVVLVPTDIRGMADALAAGRIDAFAAWEPSVSRALLAHPSFEVIDRSATGGFLFFTGAFARRHPNSVRAMTTSLVRAVRWLRVNDRNAYLASGWARERWAAFMGTPPAMSVHDIMRSARADLLSQDTAPRLPPSWLQPGGRVYEQFHLSRDLGLLQADRPWDQVRASFDLGLVPAVLKAAAAQHLDDLDPEAEP